MAQKMDLKEKLDGLGRNADERLEPLINCIVRLNEQSKGVFGDHGRVLARAVENLGSNRKILAKQATFSVVPHFQKIPDFKSTGDWLPR